MKKILVFVKKIFSNKFNLALLVVLVVVVAGVAGLAYKFWPKSPAVALPEEVVELEFNPEGSYAILEPRRDGNALVLNIKRVAGYSKITYELSYESLTDSKDEGSVGEKVDRGVQGEIKDIDLTGSKSEYSQEILFGTCSKGDTFSTLHCVFDKGVEYGTLTLKIYEKPKSGDVSQKVYRFTTAWHLQKPDVALGVVTSGDNHFIYTTKASRRDLANVGYTIVHDLPGAPKMNLGGSFTGKVYAMNVPTAKSFPVGSVLLELAEQPKEGSKLAYFSSSKNEWVELPAKITGGKVNAEASGAGLFAVVSP